MSEQSDVAGKKGKYLGCFRISLRIEWMLVCYCFSFPPLTSIPFSFLSPFVKNKIKKKESTYFRLVYEAGNPHTRLLISDDKNTLLTNKITVLTICLSFITSRICCLRWLLHSTCLLYTSPSPRD